MFALVDERKPHIIALTEVLPKRKADVTEAELSIPGYNIFINENPKRGVAIHTSAVLRLECSLDSLSIDSAHVIYVSEGYDVAV